MKTLWPLHFHIVPFVLSMSKDESQGPFVVSLSNDERASAVSETLQRPCETLTLARVCIYGYDAR